VSEHEKAKRWREKRGLSADELAEKCGFSREAIFLFEKGHAYDPARKSRPRKGVFADTKIHTRPLNERALRRYRMACAGVEAELNGQKFRW
jgi:transcriptional regulator with XRE-family HTH domain